ncbi:MAG: hypothetical protein US49_C0012G0002 [candidate division TM6 bacterium GW2011_GWF2_37_49]|nr:MAG: hypothetical protein US49_C0012G0002 [candidate division TM6 bacterium GW2011_GWF2_37_49]
MIRNFLFSTLFIILCTQSTFGATQQPFESTQIYNEQLFDTFRLAGQDRSCRGLAEKLCKITQLNALPQMIILLEGYFEYLIKEWKQLCDTQANNEICTHIFQLEISLSQLLTLIQSRSPESRFIYALEELNQLLKQSRPHEFGSLECMLHFSLQMGQIQLENVLAEKYERKNNYEKYFLGIFGIGTKPLPFTAIANKICLRTGLELNLFSNIVYGFFVNLHYNITMVDKYINTPPTNKFEFEHFKDHASEAYIALNMLADALIMPQMEPSRSETLMHCEKLRLLSFYLISHVQ